MKGTLRLKMLALLLTLCAVFVGAASGQNGNAESPVREKSARRGESRGGVRSVTIPVTVKRDAQRDRSEGFQQLSLTVLEDGEMQEILSARGPDRAPLALAVLIQDDLVPPAANEIEPLAAFIKKMPEGSRVMVGYMRAGSLQVRQKFTTDLTRAAQSLRIPVGSQSVAPFSPYEQVYQALKRFESLPTGTRRAALVVSDGLDISRGLDSSTPTQLIDLRRAINEAQRRGVAVYTIYSPTNLTNNNRGGLVGNAQSALNYLAGETGGKAFFQGLSAPVSFNPFLDELTLTLDRQFALTYLSTHTKKGFHKLDVQTAQDDVEITHPAGAYKK